MTKKWQPKGAIKSKLLPIEIAANDYWEMSKNDSDPAVVEGKKRYFTWDDAMAIKVKGGWRLPTMSEWSIMSVEFGDRDGEIMAGKLASTLKLKANGYIRSSYVEFKDECVRWSSTQASAEPFKAYMLFITDDKLYLTAYSTEKYYSLPVRLVRDVKE